MKKVSRETVPDTIRCLRVSEAAERLGISRSFCYALVASGTLPHVKLGTAKRIPLLALEQYIRDHTVEGH